MFLAGVAHPVERHLAKVEVASSSLVTRSIKRKTSLSAGLSFYFAMTRLEPSKSDSPADCRASPVLTAMLPYEALCAEAASLVTRQKHRFFFYGAGDEMARTI